MVSGTKPVRVSDIAYIATGERGLHLAVVQDLRSRRVLKWSNSSLVSTDLVLRAFWMPVLLCRPPKGPVLHSSQGSQYTTGAFVKALGGQQVIQSMSPKGSCWDSGPCEAFFSSPKNELTDGKAFPTRQAAQAAMFTHMEVFYDRQRLHSHSRI